MEKIQRITKTRKKAKKLINGFNDKDSRCLLIHYSCESFYDIKDGKTPRITSIAVRYLKTGQTKSFSIHKIAEIEKTASGDIDNNYDDLEKLMLEKFFFFVKKHRRYRWIHWNMRDINFGFEAIKHRAAILGIEPIDIKDKKKFDLSRLIINKYSEKYSKHPRLTSILEMNKISDKHWLSGDEEANAFDSKEFVKLHQSTLAKVHLFENIIRLSAKEELVTDSSLLDIYGISPQGLFEAAKDHWLYNLVMMLLSGLIGWLISNVL